MTYQEYYDNRSEIDLIFSCRMQTMYQDYGYFIENAPNVEIDFAHIGTLRITHVPCHYEQ